MLAIDVFLFGSALCYDYSLFLKASSLSEIVFLDTLFIFGHYLIHSK
jgi:hypothetical protein